MSDPNEATPDVAQQLQAAESAVQSEISALKAENESLKAELAEARAAPPQSAAGPAARDSAADELHQVASDLESSTQHGPGLIEQVAARLRSIAHRL